MAKMTGNKKSAKTPAIVEATDAATGIVTAIKLEDALGVAANEFVATGKAAMRTACSACLAYLIGIPFAGKAPSTEAMITASLQKTLEASLLETAKARKLASDPKADLSTVKTPHSTMRLYVTLGHNLYTYLVRNNLLGESRLAHDIAESADASVALATLVQWFSNQTIAIGDNMVLKHVQSIDDMRVFFELKSARPPAVTRSAQQRVQDSVKTAAKAAKATNVAPEVMVASVVEGVATSDMGIKGVQTIAREAFAKIAALATGDNLQVAEAALDMLTALRAELDKTIDGILAKAKGKPGHVPAKSEAKPVPAHKH